MILNSSFSETNSFRQVKDAVISTFNTQTILYFTGILESTHPLNGSFFGTFKNKSLIFSCRTNHDGALDE